MELWQILGIVLLALLVVAAGVIAFLLSERERRGHDQGDGDGLDDVVSVLSVLPQAVVVLEPDDEVQRASAAAHSFGLVRNDVLAHAEIRDMVTALRRDGEIRDAEVALARGPMDAGATLRMDVRVAPLRHGRVLVLAEDRTEARRLEEMRRDFTANVSHELKTPVGALSLLAETITEAADEPDTVRHFADQMRKESARLATLVQELIELSRLQEPDALVDAELVDVDEVVAEATDRVRVEAEARRVTLVHGGTRGLKVYGDSALLTTAVRNLLDNAVRYSRPAGRVSVGVSRNDALVRIAVVDQGKGIAPEQRDRVFERFFRGDEARSRETGGSGLGLSIVKHIVNDHGGTVELWSTSGKGSTFTIVLPEAYASAEDARAAEREEDPANQEPAGPPSAPEGRRRVAGPGDGSTNQATNDRNEPAREADRTARRTVRAGRTTMEDTYR
ncbi:sensor histidine kinase [Georgenia deserti]|uniref:Sensor-like histidine kinase SenX3 n=1 Tax=Georgenia deserti TaxID=2093781 RepID=A0ABW4L8R1_9MICO